MVARYMGVGSQAVGGNRSWDPRSSRPSCWDSRDERRRLLKGFIARTEIVRLRRADGTDLELYWSGEGGDDIAARVSNFTGLLPTGAAARLRPLSEATAAATFAYAKTAQRARLRTLFALRRRGGGQAYADVSGPRRSARVAGDAEHPTPAAPARSASSATRSMTGPSRGKTRARAVVHREATARRAAAPILAQLSRTRSRRAQPCWRAPRASSPPRRRRAGRRESAGPARLPGPCAPRARCARRACHGGRRPVGPSSGSKNEAAVQFRRAKAPAPRAERWGARTKRSARRARRRSSARAARAARGLRRRSVRAGVSNSQDSPR